MLSEKVGFRCQVSGVRISHLGSLNAETYKIRQYKSKK
ncbi:hypothetical protein D1AOALGA4SA_4690 [Olavius algarvensis Delta 1 endosymbiont]|nr:hypothetical protein D1AOALGA4SA_4690 [Olavius algarvensis Delta 1 endosymbiont]